jgi:hypothetical protein
VRGIVERILRIVQRVDMKIGLDPFWFTHAPNTTPLFSIHYFGASDVRIFSKRESLRSGSQNGISFN